MDTPTTAGQIINELQAGAFVTLDKVHGGGSLEARRIKTGVQLYWRYTTAGKTDRMPIGLYDPSAPPRSLTKTTKGYSVQAAIRAAEKLAEAHAAAADVGGLRAAKQAQRDALAAAREQTLDKLLEHYCDHLEAIGRAAHRDARSIFNLHVRAPWPKLVAKPAAHVTTEEIADVMRLVIQKGKGRTANKLRSYVRAAYQTAKAARTKASIPVHFKAYGITVNPAADTEAEGAHNLPDKHPLSGDELRHYWKSIREVAGIRGAVLRLHLLTGAQRIEQLVNLKTTNAKADAITLFDSKGRPGHPPRPHTVPLTTAAAAELEACNPTGAFALSTDGGESHIAATTLSAWAVAAVGDTIADFKAKRLRSGVETVLASLGVSEDVRGRLQSHGISGVQARHYDGHTYLPEKLAALKALARFLRA